MSVVVGLWVVTLLLLGTGLVQMVRAARAMSVGKPAMPLAVQGLGVLFVSALLSTVNVGLTA